MSSHKTKPQVCFSASEISTFVFCPVVWYLQKCGYKPKSSKTKIGKKKHNILGKKLMRVQKQINISNYLLLIGLFCLILSFLLFVEL